jgi:nucleotide-binding universal stress UspA family protein
MVLTMGPIMDRRLQRSNRVGRSGRGGHLERPPWSTVDGGTEPMSAYLVGVDGSAPSDAALRWAVNRAVARGMPLELVHVIEDDWGLVGSDFAREAMLTGEAVVQGALEAARAMTGTARLEVRVLGGSPVWELARACRDDDLLVIGTHKTGFLHGRVLGSRSVTISALASCSVVVVPMGQTALRHGVVVGVVRSEGSWHAVASGAREAARLDQPLVLVHSSPVGSGSPAGPREALERERLVLRLAVEAAEAAAPGVAVHTRVSSRQPAEALLDASRDAALLVLEPSRHDGRDATVLGSTTHDVLMNINSPVLIARNEAV